MVEESKRELATTQAMQHCRLLLPGRGEALVPLPVAGLATLRRAAEQHFGPELQGKVRAVRRLQAAAGAVSSRLLYAVRAPQLPACAPGLTS